MKLFVNQRLALAEFCGNFAVAWLAAGIIAPAVTGQIFSEGVKSTTIAIIWASILIFVMLFLTKGGKK